MAEVNVESDTLVFAHVVSHFTVVEIRLVSYHNDFV